MLFLTKKKKQTKTERVLKKQCGTTKMYNSKVPCENICLDYGQKKIVK